MEYWMMDWLKEMYRRHAGAEGVSASVRRVRRVHEIAFVIWGVILLNWITGEFLNELFDHFGIKFCSIDLTIMFIFLTIGFACGLILVYCYRNSEIFLPARSNMTYLATAFFWPIGTYGFGANELYIHAFREIDYYIGTIVWFVFLLGIIVPHILWRRKKPTPPILDAILISMLTVLIYKMDLYLKNNQLHTFFPWSMENMPEPVFLSLIGINWITLIILLKKSRVYKYAAVLILNAAVYVLLPRL